MYVGATAGAPPAAAPCPRHPKKPTPNMLGQPVDRSDGRLPRGAVPVVRGRSLEPVWQIEAHTTPRIVDRDAAVSERLKNHKGDTFARVGRSTAPEGDGVASVFYDIQIPTGDGDRSRGRDVRALGRRCDGRPVELRDVDNIVTLGVVLSGSPLMLEDVGTVERLFRGLDTVISDRLYGAGVASPLQRVGVVVPLRQVDG